MKVTDLKIRKTFAEGNVRAILSITLDNCIAVHDIKVIQNDRRLFVAMPSRQDKNGVFHDVIHPIYSEAREGLEAIILEAYEAYLIVMGQEVAAS